MSDFVKQCVVHRVKWSALLVFGIVVPISLLIMLVGMLAGRLCFAEILRAAAAPVGTGMVAFLWMLYHPWRFVRMIRRQEEMLGLNFGEEEFTPTAPNAGRLKQHYRFSGSWYMCEGSWALHRLYIVKVRPTSTHHNIGRMYYAWVKTIDGKLWQMPMESASDQKHFYAWWKAGRK